MSNVIQLHQSNLYTFLFDRFIALANFTLKDRSFIYLYFKREVGGGLEEGKGNKFPAVLFPHFI